MADSKGAVPLNPKQMKWAEHYAATGNALQSAIAAGYSAKSARSQSDRMLKNDEVMRYAAQLTEPGTNARIANAQERQEFWTAVMRGEVEVESFDMMGNKKLGKPQLRDRLKASEYLAKAQSDFVERHVHSFTPRDPSAMSDDELAAYLVELQQARQK